jgi:hypothetical protein
MKKSNIGGNKYLVNLCGGLLPSCWFDAGLKQCFGSVWPRALAVWPKS